MSYIKSDAPELLPYKDKPTIKEAIVTKRRFELLGKKERKFRFGLSSFVFAHISSFLTVIMFSIVIGDNGGSETDLWIITLSVYSAYILLFWTVGLDTYLNRRPISFAELKDIHKEHLDKCQSCTQGQQLSQSECSYCGKNNSVIGEIWSELITIESSGLDKYRIASVRRKRKLIKALLAQTI